MLICDCNSRVARKRRLSRKHFVQHAAGRIQVRPHIHSLSASLFGAQVLCSAHYTLILSHCRGGIVQSAGDSEIHDLDFALFADHDVSGLDIAVNNAHSVRIIQRIEHSEHNLFRVALIQSSLSLDDIAQSSSPDILHNDVRNRNRSVGLIFQMLFARIINCNDIRVVHLCDRTRFAVESGQEDGIRGQIIAHNLNRNRASQARVGSQVNLGHAAVTDKITDGVSAVCQRFRNVHAHCEPSSLLLFGLFTVWFTD